MVLPIDLWSNGLTKLPLVKWSYQFSYVHSYAQPSYQQVIPNFRLPDSPYFELCTSYQQGYAQAKTPCITC